MWESPSLFVKFKIYQNYSCLPNHKILNFMDFQKSQKSHSREYSNHNYQHPSLSLNLHENQQYNNNFDNIKLDQANQIRLLAGKRFFKKQKWADQILESCLDTDFQSTTIQLHYGFFATRVNIVNFYFQENFEKTSTFLGSGQFGKVSLVKWQEDFFAVKMIRFHDQNIFAEMKNIYKEYFIALIASQLEVGAKVVDIFGYEIVFLKDCALFGMELCRNFGSKDTQWQSLLSSLNILHSLHIIHRDLKPENIMWSHSYQKYVFIDFGLSLIIKQSTDQKTLTLFAGSYTYCSPEMKKYFLLKQSGQVNLYNNDSFGLEECKKIFVCLLFQNSVFSTTGYETLEDKDILSSFLNITRVKKAIYQNKHQFAYQYMKSCNELTKTWFYITDSAIEKKLIPEEVTILWRELKIILKQKSMRKKNRGEKIDDILMLNLKNNSKQNFWLFMILSQKFVQKFYLWSQNQVWIERIFLFLNPVNKSELTQSQLYDYSYKLIHKIYSALNLPSTNVYLEKVRAVLLYFFQKLKVCKGKAILQPISDTFILIKDNLSAMKVRDYILQKTEDLLQYCLQSLKYYLLIQYQLSYYQKNTPFNFLAKITSKIQTLPKNIKLSKTILLVLTIKQFLQNTDKENIFFTLDRIVSLLSQIQHQILQIQKPQLSEIVFRIQIRVASLYERAIYQHFSKTKLPKQFRMELQNRLNSLLCQKIHEVHHSCVSLKIINSQFYTSMKTNQLANLYNIDFTAQNLQFYYRVSQGSIFFIEQKIFYSLKKLAQIHKIVPSFVIKEEIKWANNQENAQIRKSFKEYYWHIKIVIDYVLILLKEKKKGKWVKETDEKEYFQLLNVFNHKAQQDINRLIEGSYYRRTLNLAIKICILAIKCYWLKENQQEMLIKDIKQTFQQIKVHKNEQKKVWNEHSTNHTLFFIILVIIRQNQLVKKQQNIMFMQSIFLQMFQFINDETNLIRVENSLKQMISIMIKRGLYQKNFEFLQNIIFYYTQNEFFYKKIPEYKFYIIRSIIYFQDINPNQMTKLFIRRLSTEGYKDNLQRLLTDSHGCLLLFTMLSSMKQQRQFTKKFLYKIALNLNNIDNLIKIYVLLYFYKFFILEYGYEGKKRKILGSLRSHRRHSNDSLQKKQAWTQITKMVQKIKWNKKINTHMIIKLQKI